MKTLKKILPLFAIATIVTACSEENNSAPTLEVLSPEEGKTYEYGKIIDLHLKSEDLTGIKQLEYALEAISDEGVKVNLYKKLEFTNFITKFEDHIPLVIPKKFNDSTYFDNSDYQLIIAVMDLEEKTRKKYIEFTINNAENNE